eukprot:7506582-Pyramimonas_sp.AAC.1
MEGGSFSKRGSRLSAAHIRFQNSRIEGGSFSTGGSRLSAAHIRYGPRTKNRVLEGIRIMRAQQIC